VKVTDKDREASDALHVALCPHGGRDACLCRECRAEAIAQTREEGRREERAACAKLAHDLASDYGCDWSSPEFNYAKDVEDAIRARGED